MRLWSLHPKYLDSKGLVALWREALLAQKVLAGKTKGYRHHPQLERFKAHQDRLGAIGAYLVEVEREAERRGYRFSENKIIRAGRKVKIPVGSGQLAYELAHLKRKLAKRDKTHLKKIEGVKKARAHPVFAAKKGGVEDWERPPARRK
jgi:hypothetical protein